MFQYEHHHFKVHELLNNFTTWDYDTMLLKKQNCVLSINLCLLYQCFSVYLCTYWWFHGVSGTAAPPLSHQWALLGPADMSHPALRPCRFWRSPEESSLIYQRLGTSWCCHKHQRTPSWWLHRRAWAMTDHGKILWPKTQINKYLSGDHGLNNIP